MLLGIILLIIGINYSRKKSKIMTLKHDDFQEISLEDFNKWRLFEIKSINSFLWASWGLFLAQIIVVFLVYPVIPVNIGINPKALEQNLQIGFFALFIILIFTSAIQGTKASNLRKKLGIKFPK